jgi:molecular chaperone GrpE
MATIEEERDDLKDRLLRTAAELDNFRKRARKEAELAELETKLALLRAILPVADNLERAAQHAAENDPVAVGVRLVRKQLETMFEQQGVVRFFPIGEPFDPARHEALDQIETVEMPPGTVANVLAPGYLLGDRLLRAALVTVSKAPAAREDARNE